MVHAYQMAIKFSEKKFLSLLYTREKDRGDNQTVVALTAIYFLDTLALYQISKAQH